MITLMADVRYGSSGGGSEEPRCMSSRKLAGYELSRARSPRRAPLEYTDEAAADATATSDRARSLTEWVSFSN